MSHEPECEGPYHYRPMFGEDCPDCLIARAAYQRGREDAARAIEAMEPEFCFDCGLDAHLENAAAVARGDGEQA